MDSSRYLVAMPIFVFLNPSLQPVQSSHLTRVSAPVVVARAHEDVRDDLVAAGAEEHLLAALVAHDWHRYLPKEAD